MIRQIVLSQEQRSAIEHELDPGSYVGFDDWAVRESNQSSQAWFQGQNPQVAAFVEEVSEGVYPADQVQLYLDGVPSPTLGPVMLRPLNPSFQLETLERSLDKVKQFRQNISAAYWRLNLMADPDRAGGFLEISSELRSSLAESIENFLRLANPWLSWDGKVQRSFYVDLLRHMRNQTISPRVAHVGRLLEHLDWFMDQSETNLDQMDLVDRIFIESIGKATDDERISISQTFMFVFSLFFRDLNDDFLSIYAATVSLARSMGAEIGAPVPLTYDLERFL